MNIEAQFEYATDFVLLNDEKIIFIDEIGLSCSMRIGYGRSLMGTTPKKIVRAIRSKKFSTVAASCKTGILHFKTIDRAFNCASLTTFIGEVIHLKLTNLGIFDATIIMDNASIHKTAEVKEVFKATNHKIIYLPPYSPQLNPIEEVFSKWKHILKSANCQTTEQLNMEIANSHL